MPCSVTHGDFTKMVKRIENGPSSDLFEFALSRNQKMTYEYFVRARNGVFSMARQLL
jgi:hypothetical protein